MSATQTTFSSRWTMLLAMLGMAVGTGNIWRFPRIAAANGGGSFLIPWVIFLFAWSIPLLIVEFGMGKGTRYGPVGAFQKLLGGKSAWMGAWVAWTATAIMFYYAVVVGWTFRYFFAAVLGELERQRVPGELWATFPETWQAVVAHGAAVGIGVWVVARGVRGIERVTSVLIPSLFVLVVMLAVRALTLPGAGEGLAFLFTPRLEELLDARVWLEALTQNAWDTGAGWGLALTYAVYAREREDTSANAFMLGIGNNCVSLLAGIMVICTVFSVGPRLAAEIAETPAGFEQAIENYPGLEAQLEGRLAEPAAVEAARGLGVEVEGEAAEGFFRNEAVPVETRLAVARATGALEGSTVADAVLRSGNNGLTFIWVPQIFTTLPFGRALTSLFFLALSFAALTSLISMVELATRVLVDGGLPRSQAIVAVGAVGFLLGLPSALSMPFFENQDWVWSVGLMLSGFLFAVAVLRYGVRRFRETFVNTPDAKLRVGRWWDVAMVLVAVEAAVLVVWWLWQAVDRTDLGASLTPFSSFNVGTVLVQGGIVLAVLLAANRWIARRTAAADRAGPPEGEMPPSIP